MIYIRYQTDMNYCRDFMALIEQLFIASFDQLPLTDFCNVDDTVKRYKIKRQNFTVNGRIPKKITFKFDLNVHDSIVRLMNIHSQFFDSAENIYFMIVRDKYIAEAHKQLIQATSIMHN